MNTMTANVEHQRAYFIFVYTRSRNIIVFVVRISYFIVVSSLRF